jgi:eukaryotic-like serine/threonine-protein kinase
MVLASGTLVGPYEVIAPIGAGGMGEVYRARDSRIGREVAIKVLPAALSSEPERQRRFEQEARAAGVLNHPNVLAVYDVGEHEGAPYIVSELLTGETLRRRIGGTPLPVRKAVDYAVQVARGLAAAHEKGIVHRDLKPDNLFVTRDGRVKILDFGLAKLGPETFFNEAAAGSAFSAIETATGTLPGALLGTLGYMSPEQVEGLPADARSDIFSFGAVLYEMVTGRRAFKAQTAPETLTAILKEDPLESGGVEMALAPGLERLLRHCLEKSPDERFQSARDLAFALEALSGFSDVATARSPGFVSRGRRLRLAAVAVALAAAALGAAAGFVLWQTPPPRFTQLTFRAGAVLAARFSPDGQTVAYSAAWDGGPLEIYTRQSKELDSRVFGLQRARVLSISSVGELAVQLVAAGAPLGFYPIGAGTLARIPLAGGTPREVFEDAESADWSPDGRELAVSRWVKQKCRLEYPIGKILYESDQRIPIVRVSPGGEQVAFLEEVTVAGRLFNTRWLSVVDKAGRKRALFEGWGSTGIAWSPSGREIWLDAIEGVGARAIHAISLAGKRRLLVQLAGTEGALADVSRDGRVLFIASHARRVIFALAPGEERERNLSWGDESSVVDLSRDGRTLLFNEILSSGGRSFATSIRRTDGSAAVRLGEGFSIGLSPDGQWALAFTRAASLEFVLLPTGAGEPKRITGTLPADFHGASWLPDSSGFVFSGSSPGEASRLYEQDIAGAPPRPLTDVGLDLEGPVASPDGLTIAATDADGEVMLVPRLGGPVRPLPGLQEGEIPIQWRTDGRAIYAYHPSRLPIEIVEVDVRSGRRGLARRIVLTDLTGVLADSVVTLTPDARSYAYSFYRNLSELHLVEGLD